MSKAETAEQKARDILERMGIENAQQFTAGDVVEIANLIRNVEMLELLVSLPPFVEKANELADRLNQQSSNIAPDSSQQNQSE